MKQELSGNNSSVKNHLYGWTCIPNCEKMDLFHGENDRIWEQYFGLKIRTTLKRVVKGPNGKMNKYMKYQLRRLDRKRDQKLKNGYWNIVRSLLGKSYSFRLAAFQKVIPNWSRELPLHKLKKIIAEVNEILDRFNSNDKLIEYKHCAAIKRVYFWDRDKWRPLGVPTVPWRIVMHMVNNFLVQWCYDKFLPSQHGFIPGRGTLTAWKELFGKVINSNWVLETDLKAFFPSVLPGIVTIVLRQLNVGSFMVDFMSKINRSNFIAPETVRNDGDIELLERRLEGIKLAQLSFGHVTPWFENFIDHKRTPINWGYDEGLPQGLPTSPVCSILTLPEFLSQQSCVSYADDPIFYGEKPFDIFSEKRRRISISLDKTFWIKENGIWLTKLKWLGLEYDPFKDTLSSATRLVKRSDVEPFVITSGHRDMMLNYLHISHLTEAKKMECIKKGYLRKKKSVRSSWTWLDLLDSKIGGLILSVLYNNGPDMEEVHQDFRLRGISGSWVSIKQWEGQRNLTIRNYSTKAIGCLYSLLKMKKKKFSHVRHINSPLPASESYLLDRFGL